MVARVLSINCGYNSNLSEISEKLRNGYCDVVVAKTQEDAIKILSNHKIDIIFIMLPLQSSDWFRDFFGVLRRMCVVTPIVGVLHYSTNETSWLLEFEMDDIIRTNISSNSLYRKVNTLVDNKSLFDEHLVSSITVNNDTSKKIAFLFCERYQNTFLKGIEQVYFKSLTRSINIDDIDLFVINVKHEQSFEWCAKLRLMNSHKPIIMAFDKDSKEKAKQAMSMHIGCTDIVNMEEDHCIISCRINSLIKYKRLYVDFIKRVKNCMYMSVVDPTTSVYNRSFLDEYLRNKNGDISNYAVLMVDLDRFKIINDEYGHTFADCVLQHISRLVKKNVRSSDVVARYGGDEFIVIMENVDRDIVDHIATRIQKEVENVKYENVSCTVSIGICCIENEKNIPFDEAISIADKFMYIAKQDGGNSVRICA